MQKPDCAPKDIHLSFDVGHSSLGWSVLQILNSQPAAQTPSINILGCGVVTFRADDCLASTRRTYRRQRRHIRSTRQRIARIKSLLLHLGVLTKEQVDKPGCAWPWQLAARVLSGKSGNNPALLLSWPELWDVLRWYAHNRGYDGNRRWSAAEAAALAEDTEKEENARTLMDKHGVKTMAETFCATLKIDPLGQKKSSMVRFKGLNAAFPREVVEKEVREILHDHFGKLPGMNENLEKALLSDWQAAACPSIKLPRRYQGGLLFGQLVPRFDNRIISKCPISGEKVPSRDCPEFLNFRWAMLLANIRVARFGEKELSPLSVLERKRLDALMRAQGAMGAEEFKKHIREISSSIRDNLETMFMHPDSKEALLLDPVQKLIQSKELKPVWQLLPVRLQKRTIGQWRRGKTTSLAKLRQQTIDLGESVTALDAEIQKQFDAASTRSRKKDKSLSMADLLNAPLQTKKLGQRAAYSRRLLAQAYDEVMAGKHPKEQGGCLFITEGMRQAQLNREIADQTNNHLVRHRLLILQRLLKDIIKEYAKGDKKRVHKITIEVNRDLREMSGKTAKEKAQEMGKLLANHHHVSEKLSEAFANTNTQISAGLIRKGRIADDLGWTCPYTGQKFEPVDLVTRRVDKDHIVPRSDRASDSLDSLVVTFAAVNKWKGRRTAWKFIEEEQGKPVPDLPNLSVVSLTRYRQFVEGLESYKGHADDKKRKERRKRLMLLPNYEEKEFVPRDLTQTSQLVRLGAQALKKEFQDCTQPPQVISLPGSVTGAVRKAWKVLGCLSLACPQVLDATGNSKSKTDIRNITHLHHALDACVLGLVSHFIPNNGRVWELIVKRNPNDVEKRELMSLGIFAFNAENRFEMRDLDERLKDRIRRRLAEKRVVQHSPSDMSGLSADQTVWRVVDFSDGRPSSERLKRLFEKKDIKLSNKNGETIFVTCKKRKEKGATKPSKLLQETEAFWIAYDEVAKSKLIGLAPDTRTDTPKLKPLSAVKVLADNYGVALDPEPIVIPHHKVWHRIHALKVVNSGKMPRIIRLGQLIELTAGKNIGKTWKVIGIDNNTRQGALLKLAVPDFVRKIDSPPNYKAISVISNKDFIIAHKTPLTGINSCPSTSSA